MASLLPAFLLVATLHVACADELCTRGLFHHSTNLCEWGCCYGEIDNCCYEYKPFYRTVRFIAPMAVGMFLLVSGVILSLCWCARRRHTTTTTVQYCAPPTQPQVFTTTTHKSC